MSEARCSRAITTEVSWEEDGFTDVLCPCQLHQNALHTKTPTGVRWDAVSEARHVEFKFLRVQIHGTQVLYKHTDAMLSLATRGHFVSAKVEVKATGKLLTCASDLPIDLMDVKRL